VALRHRLQHITYPPREQAEIRRTTWNVDVAEPIHSEVEAPRRELFEQRHTFGVQSLGGHDVVIHYPLINMPLYNNMWFYFVTIRVVWSLGHDHFGRY